MNRHLMRSVALACLVPVLAVAQASRAAASRPKPAPPVQAAAAATGNPVRPGDPVQGQAKADAERCIECHGSEGQGAGHANGAEGKFPKLAGQHPGYLLKQLDDFRSARRKHDVMGLMARSVEAEDLRDIVAFFATRPRAGGDGRGERAEARALFLQGDAARSLAACAGCHGNSAQGSAGTGGAAPVPALAGQEYLYLERQLLDWRSGWRSNGPDGAMNQVARLLTETEISHLAAFLSGLR